MMMYKFDQTTIGRDSDNNNTECSGVFFDGVGFDGQLNIHAIDADGLPSVEVIALPNDPDLLREISAKLAEYASYVERKNSAPWLTPSTPA